MGHATGGDLGVTEIHPASSQEVPRRSSRPCFGALVAREGAIGVMVGVAKQGVWLLRSSMASLKTAAKQATGSADTIMESHFHG